MDLAVTDLAGKHGVAQVDGDKLWWTHGTFFWMRDEGISWIRGHWAEDAPELAALRTAWALKTVAIAQPAGFAATWLGVFGCGVYRGRLRLRGPEVAPVTDDNRGCMYAHTRDEGISWIRGHFADDSPEAAALQVAYALDLINRKAS